jgi:hypothetical protein
LLLVVGSQTLLPNWQLRMASAKAGFHASLPDYQPAGYALGKLHYGPGQVATNYHSTSNDSSYTIIQKPTTWDSQTLLEMVVMPADSHYQTVQSGDRTIYVYATNSAAWINNGIWYQLQADGTLGANQLIQIASSL